MQKKTRLKLIAGVAIILFMVVIFLYTMVTFSEIKSRGIQNWHADDISLFSIKGTCQARVYNPSWFSMNCKILEFRLFYKDQEVGKADMRTPTVLNGDSETILPLSFEFNFSKFGLDDLLDLAKDSIELKTVLKGTATWLNLSFEEEGKITLSMKEWVKSKLPGFKNDDWFKWGAVGGGISNYFICNLPFAISSNWNEIYSNSKKYFYLNLRGFNQDRVILS
jgi:hypothetical protein